MRSRRCDFIIVLINHDKTSVDICIYQSCIHIVEVHASQTQGFVRLVVFFSFVRAQVALSVKKIRGNLTGLKISTSACRRSCS